MTEPSLIQAEGSRYESVPYKKLHFHKLKRNYETVWNLFFQARQMTAKTQHYFSFSRNLESTINDNHQLFPYEGHALVDSMQQCKSQIYFFVNFPDHIVSWCKFSVLHEDETFQSIL